jgi:hypothetical protein
VTKQRGKEGVIAKEGTRTKQQTTYRKVRGQWGFFFFGHLLSADFPILKLKKQIPSRDRASGGL